MNEGGRMKDSAVEYLALLNTYLQSLTGPEQAALTVFATLRHERPDR
jgi:hypothetical protein